MPSSTTPRARKKLSHYVFLLGFALVLLEAASFAGTKLLASKSLFYEPHSNAGFDDYLKRRDPVLGWTTATGDDVDATGSRRVPAYPDPAAKTCATLYGDSFTYSSEIDAEHAWGNVLAKRIGCRVANFGVPGYGTDQAFLRYKQNGSDRAPVALLGILSENIIRNVNRFRPLLAGPNRFGFKPRFALDDASAELRLVPLLAPSTLGDFRAIADAPEQHLADEFFLPGGPAGITRRNFPYSLSLLRLLGHYRARAAISRVAYYAPFFDESHPSRALAITAKIAESFRNEATARGAYGGVVILVLESDLAHHRRDARWVMQPLMDKLTAAKIPYLNAGEAMAHALGDRDPSALFGTSEFGKHPNEEGYRVLGEAVADWLQSQHALRASSP